MNKSQIAKNNAYKKYFGSDIFNQNSNFNEKESNNFSIHKKQFHIPQNTKEDLFNIGKQKRIKRDLLKNKERLSKSVEKKKQNQRESDIFFLKKSSSCEKRKGVKFIPNILNKKSALYELRNVDDYTNYIKNYELMHRDNNNTYNPETYINKITPDERYFRAYYYDNISMNNDNNKKDEQLEKFIHDRKYLKNEISKLNDSVCDRKEGLIKEKRYIPQKRNKSEEKRFFADSKNFPRHNCKINRQIQMESNIFNNNTLEDKDYFHEAKEIYYRIEKANKKQKLINKYNINNTSNKIHKNNINSEFNEYSNNTIANVGRIKNFYNINKNRKYDLITGKERIQPIRVINKNTEKNENKKILDMLESIPNLSTQNKLGIKMKLSALEFNDEKDISKKCDELKNFYKADNSVKKRKKKDITLKINDKNNNIIFNNDNLKKKPSEKYVMTYSSKSKFDKFDSNELKNIFEKKGVHIYDIHDKNSFTGRNLNAVSFKLKGENENKIQSIENDLKKENYKVKIKKDNNFKEQINKNKEEKRFKLMPKEVLKRKGFLRQYAKY